MDAVMEQKALMIAERGKPIDVAGSPFALKCGYDRLLEHSDGSVRFGMYLLQIGGAAYKKFMICKIENTKKVDDGE